MAIAPIASPQISHHDMRSFLDAHFSEAAIGSFASRFLSPGNVHDAVSRHVCGEPSDEDQQYEEDGYYDEEDDGLGYYPDGVKRTLTDEQIAMFRHSELEALRRAKEKAGETWALTDRSPDPENEKEKPCRDTAAVGAVTDGDDLSEGEIQAEQPIPGVATKKKKKKRRPNKIRNNGEQFDLRKRTWDVVETGLGTLDYDEQDNSSLSTSEPAQRRQISYDDD